VVQVLSLQEAPLDRRIKSIKKDRKGNVVALCNPGASWSPRKVPDVMKDITSNERSYYVQETGKKTYVRVQDGALRTTNEADSKNNLDSLPST
jgi:hypothetical protein